MTEDANLLEMTEWPGLGLCARCLSSGNVHRAWALVDGYGLCIRHAIESAHPEDQMRESDAIQSIYSTLLAAGVHNVY